MRVLILTVAAAVSLAGCSGGPVDSTGSVCDEFAAFVKDGRPADQRADIVRSIGEVIDNADKKVRDAYPPLTRTVQASGGAQSLADDTFAQACFDAGWKG